MRIVMDTNVLVSAFGWDGNERTVLLETLSGEHDLLISADIITEFIHVFSYKKFSHIPVEKICHFLEIMMETSVLIDVKTRISIVKGDPEDNRILECAVDGNADYIVSGDKHLLDLKVYKGIEILNARSFLEIV
jgi:putative PIN family toxin of toxin-antitoxin system